MNLTENFTTIGGVATRTLSVDGPEPPILLLHGFTDSADTWRPVLDEFATRGVAALAVDMPGGGHADPVRYPILPSLDRFVDALITEYAPTGTTLVGNSLGGFAALRAATRPGTPVDAVVGLGPAGISYTRRLRALSTLTAALDGPARLVDMVPVPTAVIRRAAFRLYDRRLAGGKADPSLARRYARHFDGAADVARLRRDLVQMSKETDVDLLDVAAITVPVQLIWGAKDQLADVNGAPAFLAAVPTARLERLEKCGHCPQLEVPRLVADLTLALRPSRRSAGE